MEIIKNNTVDILGINYYQPRRIKAKETEESTDNGIMPDNFFDNYEMPNRKMNPYRGWEIYEKGIYDILTKLRENYGNIKCFISENGMGFEGEERYINEEGQIDDDYRIEFVKITSNMSIKLWKKEVMFAGTICVPVCIIGLGPMHIKIVMALFQWT